MSLFISIRVQFSISVIFKERMFRDYNIDSDVIPVDTLQIWTRRTTTRKKRRESWFTILLLVCPAFSSEQCKHIDWQGWRVQSERIDGWRRKKALEEEEKTGKEGKTFVMRQTLSSSFSLYLFACLVRDSVRVLLFVASNKTNLYLIVCLPSWDVFSFASFFCVSIDFSFFPSSSSSSWRRSSFLRFFVLNPCRRYFRASFFPSSSMRSFESAVLFVLIYTSWDEYLISGVFMRDLPMMLFRGRRHRDRLSRDNGSNRRR